MSKLPLQPDGPTLEDVLFQWMTRNHFIGRIHVLTNSKNQVTFYLHPLGDCHEIVDGVVVGNEFRPNRDMANVRRLRPTLTKRVRKK